MSNWSYVGVAYALTYLTLGLYVVRLIARRRTLEQNWRSRTDE
jgi:CcmD family protein